jgi:2-phosphoglycerate kinase
MPHQQKNNTIDAKVKEIVADNLHIHLDAVHGDFHFNRFMDHLATYRIRKSGNHHLLYYLEAVNIYFDLSEEFKIEIPLAMMDKDTMTIDELVQYIQEQCDR